MRLPNLARCSDKAASICVIFTFSPMPLKLRARPSGRQAIDAAAARRLRRQFAQLARWLAYLAGSWSCRRCRTLRSSLHSSHSLSERPSRSAPQFPHRPSEIHRAFRSATDCLQSAQRCSRPAERRSLDTTLRPDVWQAGAGAIASNRDGMACSASSWPRGPNRSAADASAADASAADASAAAGTVAG